ncbi:MAG: DNA-directed RNA polymerase subunit alpha [Candidatus Omnitrophica bacterium]|nr:DNA-directed RNA polymerase subunit alpha [Candidatus Omnitrophota bacterium]
MGITWRNFEIPKKLSCDESTATNTYSKFIAEPFERGYGITIGNALRRILLSSIEGAAVTSVKIANASHEFAAMPGIAEDVVQITLGLKQLILRSFSKEPKTVYLKVDKKGDITAGDIEAGETIEILNPDLHLATLTKKTKFEMELVIEKGRGYVPAERNKKEGQPLGTIPVDSIFTPVTKVNVGVENTRVGQMTDYDKLILEIWTNGSITPKDALLYASHILQRHLDIFVNFGKLPEEEEEPTVTPEETELYDKLSLPISELELSVRSSNCLKEGRIKTIGDLVKRSELEMLKYRNFGKKSLAEINKILVEMGLTLGMKFDESRVKKTAPKEKEM